MQRDLVRLREHTFDVLVVGGGIHGAWAAWDATLRGRSVALLEKADFGAATSANSLKIIHGGLRYLQSADIRRMRESIGERAALLNVAPHLVHPLPCVVPTRGRGLRSRTAMRAALRINDAVGFDRNRHGGADIPDGRIISAGELRRLFPFVDDTDASGGALWYDAQVRNSERLTLSILLAASERGAAVVNYTRVDELCIENDTVQGVRATDLVSGERFMVRSRVVVDASGPWVGQLLARAKSTANGPDQSRPRLAQAMNLVASRPLLPAALGLQSQTPSHRDRVGGGQRLLFLVPWRSSTLIGTWYPRCDLRPSIDDDRPDRAHPRESDLQELVDQCNLACPALSLTLDDVTFYHRGWLPLQGRHERGRGSVLAARGHVTNHGEENEPRGLVSLEGVKYTTARLIAERAVDAAFRVGKWTPVRCTTAEIPLAAGEPRGRRNELEGSAPGQEPIAPGAAVRRGDIIRAIREEMALTLEDVVFRRTVMGSEAPPDPEHLSGAADVCAAELGWSGDRRKREIRAVRAAYAPLPSR